MKCWWMSGLLLVSYGAALAANVGHFAWSYPVGWIQSTTSALYAAVWIVCLILGRSSGRLMQLAVIMGAAMAGGSLLGFRKRRTDNSCVGFGRIDCHTALRPTEPDRRL